MQISSKQFLRPVVLKVEEITGPTVQYLLPRMVKQSAGMCL